MDADDPIELIHDGVDKMTDAAALIRFPEGPTWIPLAEIDGDIEETTVTIPFWLANDRGLI